jgi:hypothetical protein
VCVMTWGPPCVYNDSTSSRGLLLRYARASDVSIEACLESVVEPPLNLLCGSYFNTSSPEVTRPLCLCPPKSQALLPPPVHHMWADPCWLLPVLVLLMPLPLFSGGRLLSCVPHDWPLCVAVQ